MNSVIEKNGKKYDVSTLQLILGDQDFDVENEINPEYLLLCEAVDNPSTLPFLLADFYSIDLPEPDDFRLSLMRVQVDSDLRLGEDIQKHQQRAYVARIIEKIIFSELFLTLSMEEQGADGEGLVFLPEKDT
ncbi:hypothetical protein J2755_001122 [Methanohalophilus levihalophilus]|uniref:hypothetical protein n=1 Tax=Methanohalophilus levihalophilus TaxID=1431282 RepID=UPI001AE78BF2|nr:hypothetical protein [Methanohalophilus levihalophilus]MBP2030188.1 hypothetical protein [Methanohalophilus levihalophilus]